MPSRGAGRARQVGAGNKLEELEREIRQRYEAAKRQHQQTGRRTAMLEKRLSLGRSDLLGDLETEASMAEKGTDHSKTIKGLRDRVATLRLAHEVASNPHLLEEISKLDRDERVRGKSSVIYNRAASSIGIRTFPSPTVTGEYYRSPARIMAVIGEHF